VLGCLESTVGISGGEDCQHYRSQSKVEESFPGLVEAGVSGIVGEKGGRRAVC
jgi:hypothetical protein